jgi:CheY-like chemotaxis protein
LQQDREEGLVWPVQAYRLRCTITHAGSRPLALRQHHRRGRPALLPAYLLGEGAVTLCTLSRKDGTASRTGLLYSRRRNTGPPLAEAGLASAAGHRFLLHTRGLIDGWALKPLQAKAGGTSSGKNALATPQGHQMTSASLTGRSILVIEDEPLIAIAIQRELQDEGAKVQTARTLASASHALQGEDLSAAIVDVALADGDTSEICAVLNSRHIPFIVHTGYEHGRDIDGAAAVIPKPALSGSLVTALRKALLASQGV